MADDPLGKLTDADKDEIRQVLAGWRAEGVDNPTLPMFDDVDGDGTPDFLGLDDAGELVVVSGATLEGSVFESTGETGA